MSRRTTFATVFALVVVFSLSASTLAGASTHGRSHKPVAAKRPTTKKPTTATKKPVTTTPAAATPIAPPAVPSPPAALTLPWSGYVDLAPGVYTGASASWTVPTATCATSTAPDTYSLQWVGIDGYRYGNNTVEQDGTEVDCVGTTPTYRAWYEMWGNPALNNGYQVAFGQTLSPGDHVTASVALAQGTWTFILTDVTADWTTSATAPEPGTSQLATAEFIVERPLECEPGCVLSTLAPFTPVTFTNITVTSAPIASTNTDPGQSPAPAPVAATTQPTGLQPLTMYDGNFVLLTSESPLNAGSFTDIYLTS
jgi:hypothetical protein